MAYHEPIVLGVSPGSRYMGFAILQGRELRDWGIRVIKKRSLKEKLAHGKRLVNQLVDEHQPSVFVIKKLHPARTSPNLNGLTAGLVREARSRGLRIREYSIAEVEAALCGTDKANKARLAECICGAYPFLGRELEKEKTSRNPYHIRMFEAVALGLVGLGASGSS